MKKGYLIIGIVIVIFMFFLFPILILLFKPFWPEEWSSAAQATLAAAITAGIVSIFGICLKFIFDQISSETRYNQKISEKMISKIHTYAEEYYVPMAVYAGKSASLLNDILKKSQASTKDKLALFFITKYFRYKLKLTTEKGGLIFLQNLDQESYLGLLDTNAEKYLKLTREQICRLQKSIALEDTFLDFSIKIQNDYELNEIYKAFKIWLKNYSDVKKTIKCFQCHSELTFHELNSIYKPWYKKKAPKIPPECKRALKTLKKLENLEKKKDKGRLSENKYNERKKKEEEKLNN